MIVAQLSDAHVSGDAPEAGERLALAVAHLLALHARPDVVFVTGDLADHGTPAEYARVRELLAPLPMPVYVVPGNHDDRAPLRAAFGPQGREGMDGFVQFVVDAGPLRLVALDTLVSGPATGALCAERRRWLEARLSEAPERPTLLFMHHPPFRTGIAPLDDMGLAAHDAAALGEIVARHPQVVRVLAGHVHCALSRPFHGALAMTCGATASRIEFDRSRPDRVTLVDGPPECLLHAWDDGAGLLSHASVAGGPATRRVVFQDGRWRS